MLLFFFCSGIFRSRNSAIPRTKDFFSSRKWIVYILLLPEGKKWETESFVLGIALFLERKIFFHRFSWIVISWFFFNQKIILFSFFVAFFFLFFFFNQWHISFAPVEKEKNEESRIFRSRNSAIPRTKDFCHRENESFISSSFRKEKNEKTESFVLGIALFLERKIFHENKKLK